jgi:hypothetical protein
MKKLTNTYKVIYRNEKNTNETSKSNEEEFNVRYALSLQFFFYGHDFSLYNLMIMGRP